MKTLLGGLVGAALLLLNSTAFASNPAPGVQVIVKNGNATVFKGVTDGSGRFYTPPLPPGTYLFDVRGPKVLAPNRYFLALAGARPVGETMTNAAGDLAMQAEVRQGKSINGQVRAFRVLRFPPPVDPASGYASPTSGAGFQNAAVPTGPTGYYAPSSQLAVANRGAASPTVAAVQPTARIASTQPTARPMAVSPSSTGAQPAVRPAATSQMSTNRAPVPPSVAAVPPTARPASAQPVVRPATTSQTSAMNVVPGSVSVARNANPLPLIIGGKRYIWRQTTPGSTVGRWVLDTRQPTSSQAAPVKRPSSSPSPTPTPARRR